ncbi:hypothetical protein VJJ74_08200, partial [Parvimonas micra]
RTTLVGAELVAIGLQPKGVGEPAHGGATFAVEGAFGSLVVGDTTTSEGPKNRVSPDLGDLVHAVAAQRHVVRAAFADSYEMA